VEAVGFLLGCMPVATVTAGCTVCPGFHSKQKVMTMCVYVLVGCSGVR
jgi:hypothetical protein